jgi:hypothetical protein
MSVGGMGDVEVEGGMLGEVSTPELDPLAGGEMRK